MNNYVTTSLVYLSHHLGASLSIVTSSQNKALRGLKGGALPKPGKAASGSLGGIPGVSTNCCAKGKRIPKIQEYWAER
jgi:hypothetical protein